MPLIRRIPKRGFNNSRHATRYAAVNVGALNGFTDGTRVDETQLREAGLVNGRHSGVKVLGDGELARRLVVCAQAFSGTARAKIEAAGGTCERVKAAAS
jgi:large subunit ribosomal protein L15